MLKSQAGFSGGSAGQAMQCVGTLRNAGPSFHICRIMKLYSSYLLCPHSTVPNQAKTS